MLIHTAVGHHDASDGEVVPVIPIRQSQPQRARRRSGLLQYNVEMVYHGRTLHRQARSQRRWLT